MLLLSPSCRRCAPDGYGCLCGCAYNALRSARSWWWRDVLPEPIAVMVDACRPCLAEQGLIVPDRPTGIVLRGRARGRQVSVIVYDETGRVPVAFIKTARADGAADIVTEHSALERVRTRVGTDPSISHALGLVTTVERVMLVQSVIPGTQQFHVLRARKLARRRLAAADLRTAVAWLLRFQLATIDKSRPLDAVEALRFVSATLDEIRELTPEREAAIDHLTDVARRSGALLLPRVWAHGDLWPGNLLRSHGEIGVIDWSHFTEDALPIGDLAFLLFTWAHAMPWRARSWSTPEQAFERTFIESGWYRELAEELIAAHLAALEIPADMADALLVLDLHRRATSHLEAPVGPEADWRGLLLRMLDRA